ncbi:hypothetical protein QLQ12_17595 [Actinoplanes sp. NEAU-A12]|uniref:Uncharacterized protein n=1 Tax=Actinoplanes sandaracinus TaxID=3045177 RepID=A0ABT6WL13_9ACTN|nr:hypothetical protein [Actinoplanes sandaracinus]MDI6100425.1 hypothetical protein [Actinoplanes sandaracinus]
MRLIDGESGPVAGTPRWAVVAAWATVWCVIPSSVWRSAVGLGAGLGMSDQWRELQQIPGPGTVYVLSLSVLSIAFASLTLGLVYPWGERVPARVPVIGGRRYPTWLVAGLAAAGVVPLAVIVVMSAANWDVLIGAAGRPPSGWTMLATACYLPAALWPVLVTMVTVAYVRRRARRPDQEPSLT